MNLADVCHHHRTLTAYTLCPIFSLPHSQAPVKLVPFHTRGLPPSYFIVAGLVFTIVTVPYLKAEYGKVCLFDALRQLGNTSVVK